MLRVNNRTKIPITAESWLIAGVLSALFAVRIASAAVTPPPPTPEEGDKWGAYVADQETYDSNLYRLPAGSGSIASVVAPNASRADAINTGSLGGDGQWLFGRQVVDLDLRIDENRFARNTSLNNTSGFGKATWNWLVGSKLSGQVGADYNRSLAAFAETLYLGRDLVNTKDFFGNAHFQVGPHWAVFGDIRKTDYSHGAPSARYSNFRDKSGGVGLEYAINVDDSFQLEYSYTDGYYPQDFIFNNQLINRNFREDTARLLVKYALSDKTAISGYAGYLKRDYVETQIGRYTGDIWRVTVDWRPTGKTELVGASWHELHSYSVSEADYFVSHGASISPGWVPTEKITLSLVFTFEDQNFIASSTSVLVTGPRTDKITGEQLNLLYTPRANWYLNVFFRNEQRSSSVQGLKFNDQRANASITFKFL